MIDRINLIPVGIAVWLAESGIRDQPYVNNLLFEQVGLNPLEGRTLQNALL